MDRTDEDRAAAAVLRGLGGVEDFPYQAGFYAYLALRAAKGHTCTPGVIGSAYGCNACGIGPETIQ